MKIILEPTNSVETFKGAQFRLFTGMTDGLSGVRLQMLGMFRINDPIERAKFVAQLADAVQHQAPSVTTLLDAGTLITGAEAAVKKRRELVARSLLAIALTARKHPDADFSGEGAWAQFLPIADTLLAELEKAR